MFCCCCFFFTTIGIAYKTSDSVSIDFFNWVKGLAIFCVIREYTYCSTLYVGLARAISPTNTNFRLTFLLTRLQEALYKDLAV